MYPLALHKTLSPEKWSGFPVDKQLLMIGNELGRMLSRIKANGALLELTACLERAMELTDLTVCVASGNLRRELLRWRDLFASLYLMNEADLRKESENIKKLLQALLLLSPGSALCKV